MFSAKQLASMAPKKMVSQARHHVMRMATREACGITALPPPQATFDEAVKENIDEFDMQVRAAARSSGSQPRRLPHARRPCRFLQPEEALASAVAEFEAQGVDQSCLIKTVAGGNTDGYAAEAARRGSQPVRSPARPI